MTKHNKTSMLSRKRKVTDSTTAIDRLLIEGAGGRKTAKSVEESLRASVGGIRKSNINFVPFDPPYLSSSAMVDEDKVILLKPDADESVVLLPTPPNSIAKQTPADCYVGAMTGSFKALHFDKSLAANVNDRPVGQLRPATDGVTAMCFAALPDSRNSQQCIATAHGDRRVRLYDTITGRWVDWLTVDGGTGPVKDIQFLESSARLVTGVESGVVQMWEGVEAFRRLLNDAAADGEREAATTSVVSTLNVGPHLAVIRRHPTDERRLASGGTENLLKVWDLEAGRAVFTAKNVRHDILELRVAIDERNIQFMSAGGNFIATTTGTHLVRLYDVRAQRRPVNELEWMESPIGALSTCHLDNHILAGNNTADLGHFDLRFGSREKISLVAKYKGFAGAIRSISAHPTAPLFASCGLDRFVIVHDLRTRVIRKKIFCKVQLTRVLLCEHNSITNPRKPTAKKQKKEEIDDEDDDIEILSDNDDGAVKKKEDPDEEDGDGQGLDDLLEAPQ